MKLDRTTIAGLAQHLEDAELKAHDVTKITDDHPDMDWDDAYAIQDEIRRRKESRGIRIVGLKAGLTSFAKMKQMGVSTPVFGFVADYMACVDGGEVKTKELVIHLSRPLKMMRNGVPENPKASRIRLTRCRS